MPIQDETKFEDVVIDTVERHDNGWMIGHDGLCFGGIPADTPVEPKVGMTARFVPGTLGYRVRGLSLDGVTIFYRTEAEDEEQSDIDVYGKDAADLLARWDAGRSIFSIEMGGLGPGYEQAIQITMVETLRHLLAEHYNTDFWNDKDQWKADREKIEKFSFANEQIKRLGLSGAQWGAALNLACRIYQDGPRKIMNDKAVKDRHIQVSKNFPS